jgi:hypothetical protein
VEVGASRGGAASTVDKAGDAGVGYSCSPRVCLVGLTEVADRQGYNKLLRVSLAGPIYRATSDGSQTKSRSWRNETPECEELARWNCDGSCLCTMLSTLMPRVPFCTVSLTLSVSISERSSSCNCNIKTPPMTQLAAATANGGARGDIHATPDRSVHVLIIGDAKAPELQAVQHKLPAGAVLVGIGGSSAWPACICNSCSSLETCFSLCKWHPSPQLLHYPD